MDPLKTRRAHIRKRAQLPLAVRSVTDADHKSRDCSQGRFVGVNLSAQGLGLETLFELKAGDTLSLELTIPDVKPIALGAVVRSISTEKRGKHLVYRAGLEFSQVSEADQKAIASYAANMGVIV